MSDNPMNTHDENTIGDDIIEDSPSQTNDPHPITRLIKRIACFPIIRIILALLFVVGICMIILNILAGLILIFYPTFDINQNSLAIPALFAFYGMYILYVKIFEKRFVSELDFRFFIKEFWPGLVLGSGFLTLVIAILTVFGLFRITGMNEWTAAFIMFVPFIAYAYVEEVIFRAIIFRMLEEWRGTISAIIYSSLVFGFIHYSNENSTFVSSLFISLEAGPLLAAAYVYTRRLWFPIGIHFAWNYIQGGIFGASTSGVAFEGLFTSKSQGPELLSGGPFGPEASIITVLLGLSFGIVLLLLAEKQKKVVHLSYLKKQKQQSTPETDDKNYSDQSTHSASESPESNG